MHSLLRILERHGVPDAAAKAALVVAVFFVAWFVTRIADVVIRGIQARAAAGSPDGHPLAVLSERETTISILQTSVRYVAFLFAFTLALVTIAGARGISALAGASFVAVLVGFAAQRFLIDLMAGIVMVFERWYTVGSTIVVEPWKLEGVVEEISLRATTLRDVSGELLRVHNSQILAIRVLPDGARRVEIELFVHDREAGEELVERAATLVPSGPTAFIRPPEVRTTEELADDLYRITADAAVAAGRNWLADDLLPSLLKERARNGLIVHGPVVLPVDEHAISRFARAERRLQVQRQRTSRRRLRAWAR